MEQRLADVLSGREENYILPFFWQHGEGEETLREYMRVIRGYGIRAVCVESRPHPDYVGPGWWRDMDVIMEEAESLGMKVWVLDDAHFPTGFCNGQIAVHPEYGKGFLDHYTVDVRGPLKNAQFIVRLEEGERLLGVTAGRRLGNKTVGSLECAMDLSMYVKEGLLSWDVPEGFWNIIVLKTTRRSDGRKNYCNLLDRRAVRFFLDTVYEPHWAHYRERFGTVFAGFFSDEPELGNTLSAWPDSAIGNPAMALPWCEELEEMAGELWGKERNQYLSALWCNMRSGSGKASALLWERARYEYMNMVTDLYGKNFCMQVGQWCAEHGVEYIGHIIEDNGNHARTGYGTGHFFKALWGQQMSGIDVVLQQIRPGFDDRDFYHIGGKNTYNGILFHYGLAKLGSSLAHLDPAKRGRTMCEVFGAYGWTEGLKLMKWISDHMLARGVNYYVPHAFTPAPFPDPDCPPHFYAHGMNPQYPYFGELAAYMNRVSHLISGGEHLVRVAILYTAELQWIKAGEPFENLAKLLLQNQFDYDLVPIGLLETGIWPEEGKLRIGDAEYSVLLLPVCEKIPEELADWILEALGHDFPVIAAGGMPGLVESGWRQSERFAGWQRTTRKEEDGGKGRSAEGGKRETDLSGVIFCKNDQKKLLRELSGIVSRTVECHGYQPGLRCYRYRHAKGEYVLFFQEDTILSVEEWLTLPELTAESAHGRENNLYLYWYDAMDNRLERAKTNASGQVWLKLSPGEARILCALKEEADGACAVYPVPETRSCLALEGAWQLSLKAYSEKAFGGPKEVKKLANITAVGEQPDFSGVMRYQKSFVWDAERDGSEALLNCGEVYETLAVWLNGKRQGVRIAPPYRLPLRELRTGENHLVIEVTNTLVHKLRDAFSVTMPVEPSGLLGPVCVEILK